MDVLGQIQPRTQPNGDTPPGRIPGGLDATERLLTAREVANRLGVSERWVRDHATRRNPRIRAIKLGPLLRFRWADVQIMVEKLATDHPFKRG